jgi:CRP-like cAMP-binding protein
MAQSSGALAGFVTSHGIFAPSRGIIGPPSLRNRSAGPRVISLEPMVASGEDILELLGRVPLFSTLVPEELDRVAEVAVPRQFQASQVVFREGDTSDTCYVIRSGHARAIRAHQDGRSITLAQFGPGDFFGELAMLDEERRSATIETLEEMEAIAILGADMRRLLRQHPEISVKLITTLGRRLRETNERLTRQSFQTVQSRVATVLGQLVSAAQAEGAPDRDVLINSTQAELAQLAGSSRESASRFLAVLERAGIITQGRGRLIVHDRAALERYVY